MRQMAEYMFSEKEEEKNAAEAIILVKALKFFPSRTNSNWEKNGLFQISLNRKSEAACLESIVTVKADAALRVFNISAAHIRWAILDSGIDATHPAFSTSESQPLSRVIATYDFTKLRELITLASTPGNKAARELSKLLGITSEQANDIRNKLAKGGEIDWQLLRPYLQVQPDGLATYGGKLSPHGTHVAGILGGRRYDAHDDGIFCGMCPDIQLIDIRILDENERSDEFVIMGALQFIHYLNATSDEPYVHGVNLSIQLTHDPRDYATGRTPICDECNRLVASGVVVVVAAGNLGVDRNSAVASTTVGSFRDASIADPGNAERVITVGSTHRKRPYTYGISYFSSRGPTGDGRQKPDLVAPGEKILGPIPSGQYTLLEGTSMAAPHVSGAAALLLAQYSELIGDADRVKQILCNTATDLGRMREYQGAGLVDVLRALQSI